MKISFDPAKRQRTLEERGLDFADAPLVFAGTTIDFPDLRRDYRGESRHVISMRKANDREKAEYRERLAQG